MNFSLRDLISTLLHRRIFLFNFLWAGFLFILTKFLIGNYYEVYECIPPTTISGKLMDGVPANIIYPIASVLLSDFYVLLYSAAPDISWYDYMMSGYMILSAAVIFMAIHFELSDKISLPKIILLNTTIFFLFIADNVVNWNFTRTAFIVCIAAFIWFALVLSHRKFSRQLLYAAILNSALFTIGTLIRPEVGELMLIMIGCWVFCRTGFGKEAGLKLLPFFIPVLLIAGAIFYDRQTTTEFYKQLDPMVEYQISLGNVVGVEKMKTTQDSMKYVALREGIVNDPHYITNDFMRSIVAKKNPIYFSRNLFDRANKILGKSISTYWHIVLLAFFFLVFGIFILRKAKLTLLRFLLFTAFFWFMLFAISYFMIMETRLFGPLLFFYIASMNLFLYSYYFKLLERKKIIRSSLFIFVLFVLAINLFCLGKTRIQYETKIALNHYRFEQLKKAAAGKILVPDASVVMIIFFNNFRPFQMPDFSAFRKIFMIDMEAMSLAPAYRAYVKKHCHCDPEDLGDLFSYFHLIKNEVVFAGKPERIALFRSYLSLVHRQSYQFKQFAEIKDKDVNQKEDVGICAYTIE